MINEIQWTPPEDSKEFMEWLEKWHKKWVRDSEEETLTNILCTLDGLGSKVKLKALEILLLKLQKEG